MAVGIAYVKESTDDMESDVDMATPVLEIIQREKTLRRKRRPV